MVPSGTSLLGLVKHLAAVEYVWFCETFGRPAEPLSFDENDEDADLRVEPHETTDDIVQFYGRARAAANRVIEELAPMTPAPPGAATRFRCAGCSST